MTDNVLSRSLRLLFLFSLLTTLLTPLANAQPGILEITYPTGTYDYFNALGMSADGKVIFGSLDNAYVNDIPVVWDAQNGFQPLPFSSMVNVHLCGISADGSIVVGYKDSSSSESQAFAWSKLGIQHLPALGNNPGFEPASYAFSVSADGRKVAGWSTIDNACSGQSTKWIDGMPNMLAPIADCGAWFTAISPNGEYVFGEEEDVTGHCFLKWGPNLLPTKLFSGVQSIYLAASSYSGDTVIVFFSSGGTYHELRITPQGVDTLQNWAETISWDGSRMVGAGYISDSGRTNPKPLKEVCENEYGIDCSDIVFASTPAISADGTVILALGSTYPYRAYRLTLKKTISVITPKDSLYVVDGRKGKIKWRTPAGVDTVDIYYTLDSGKTRTPIEKNYAVKARKDSLSWSWPDVVSQDCKIIIMGSRDTTIRGESPIFTIRGYRLLRTNPTTKRYELFDLAKHGWQFANEENVMWPNAWWANFHYSGAVGNTDPYTHDAYPDRDPFKTAQSSDFIDWPLFVRTMGEQACYYIFGGSNTGIYKGAAEVYWGAHKKAWGGSCYGFAVSTLMAFDIPTQLAGAFPEMPPFNEIPNRFVLSGFGPTDPVRRVINSLYYSQHGKQHESYYLDKLATTSPKQTLAELKEMFLSDSTDHKPLSLVPTNAKGGHEVVPYRITNDPPGSATFRIYVNDSNIPADQGAFVQVDTSVDTWSYAKLKNSFGSSWWGNKGLTLDDPVSGYVDLPILPKTSSHSPIRQKSPFLAADSTWAVYPPSESEVTISDNLGRTIRAAGDTVKCDIPGSYPMKPVSTTSRPPGFVMPKGDYSVQIDAFTDTGAVFTLSTDEMFYVYRRRGIQSGERDRIRIGGAGLQMRNDDMSSKTFDLEAVIPAANDSAEHRVLLSGLTAEHGDSLLLSVNSMSNPVVRNFGTHATQYTLSLLGYRYVEGVGVDQQQFKNRSIPLGPASTHTVNPVWESMNGEQLKIYIDNGNDGTVDDSLIVQNEAAAVKDRRIKEVPKAYALMQNYPDPFNPATTIEFGLPEQSVVELKIYTILGQEIATLARGTMSAGTYRYTFDGSSLAAGVYLYRMTAASVTDPSRRFSEVRKMLLIK